MAWLTNRGILAPVAYADIFDYPLTREEVIKFSPIKGDSFANAKVSPYWTTSSYFHLPGRQKLVSLRKKRWHFSQLKWQKLKQIKWLFSLIPWIKLVGVTGALSMNNSIENDDIDLLIITSKNRLWLARLLLTALLFFRLRRGHKINNRFCLNLFLDESALILAQQNLYTAHELCQLKPLYNRDQAYQNFLTANSWYKQYLPNFFQGPSFPQGPTLKDKSEKRSDLIGLLMDFFESLAFKFQYFYMKRKITHEKIGRHFAFFHPRPTGEIVLKKYHKATKIILVTGVFDILHIEHKKLLLAAKNQGGILLVGVEADQRVRQLKGPGRPINKLEVRIKNLQKLKLSDEVFPLPEKFDSDEDHSALINQIKPDILAVSSSTPNLAVKRRTMQCSGGRVVIVLPHNPQISTTKIIKSQ
ncbi:MAG: adenylyltransferase/cytidyltransferase family protein [Candidatus Beckwithbacteria bacterium]|nr:adenylyltransferase/cytidyltransferase family protein [Candidatus Beckwithbacteria bacterium]